VVGGQFGGQQKHVTHPTFVQKLWREKLLAVRIAHQIFILRRINARDARETQATQR